MKYRGESWQTKSSIPSGERGTAKVYAEFGDKLVCVRYRYNGKGLRIKTAEIVIDTAKITPRLPPSKDRKEIKDLILTINRNVHALCTCKSLALSTEGHDKSCPARRYLKSLSR